MKTLQGGAERVDEFLETGAIAQDQAAVGTPIRQSIRQCGNDVLGGQAEQACPARPVHGKRVLRMNSRKHGLGAGQLQRVKFSKALGARAAPRRGPVVENAAPRERVGCARVAENEAIAMQERRRFAQGNMHPWRVHRAIEKRQASETSRGSTVHEHLRTGFQGDVGQAVQTRVEAMHDRDRPRPDAPAASVNVTCGRPREIERETFTRAAQLGFLVLSTQPAYAYFKAPRKEFERVANVDAAAVDKAGDDEARAFDRKRPIHREPWNSRLVARTSRGRDVT